MVKLEMGFENWKRDALCRRCYKILFSEKIVDSMKYILTEIGAQFRNECESDTANPVLLYSYLVSLNVVLIWSGLDKQEIINLKDVQKQIG